MFVLFVFTESTDALVTAAGDGDIPSLTDCLREVQLQSREMRWTTQHYTMQHGADVLKQ